MDCFFCKGELIESTTTHVVKFKNCIIIIKNVPCYECEQCGEAVYTDEVAEQLEIIVKSLRETLTEVAIVNYSQMYAS